MIQIMKDILKLSISERILMVENIWDSIAEDDKNLKLTEETKQFLDERLEAHKNNPSDGSSWTDVKTRIKKQF